VSGPSLADALRARELHRRRGLGCTIGYFDRRGEPPEAVAERHLEGIEALRGSDDYVSLKLPSLAFSGESLAGIALRAEGAGIRIHFDSLAIEAADRTRASIEHLLGESRCPIGITIPGRWARSLEDAAWARERGLPVRVVKGEWSDPSWPSLDPSAGFLDVVDRLAGTRSTVSLATHDTVLVEEAVRRLRKAGTEADLELLAGLPLGPSLEKARRLGMSVRLYVAYGRGYLPYAVDKALERPSLVWWLVRDFLRGI
jgi:proline dehydrogenase